MADEWLEVENRIWLRPGTRPGWWELKIEAADGPIRMIARKIDQFSRDKREEELQRLVR